MKHFSKFLLILFGISCLSAQDAKKTIAVLDLDPTGIATSEAQFLTDRLRTELFETGAFQVVERDKMNAILSEQGFQRTGCTTVECAVEIGQLLNVKSIVAGSIGKIEELYSISLRMIDVQTGAIIKTATQDYRGKLSEVLTEVIPEIASSLAREEKTAVTKPKDQKPKITDSESERGKKFGVMFKVGRAFLEYTADANDAIAKMTDGNLYFDEYSNHDNYVMEINYFLTGKWQVKFNLGVEKILNNWTNEKYFAHLASNIRSFAHNLKFTNLGLGLNYYLLKKPSGKFDWYVGSDIGAMDLQVHVTTRTTADLVFDRKFKYQGIAFKLATGCGYFLFSSLRVGLELALQGTNDFDLSKQQIMPNSDPVTIPYEIASNEKLMDILLLKKFSASGIQINTTLSYYF